MSERRAMLFCPPLPPLRLEGPGPFAIGRQPDCEFPIRQSHVSRRHAEIRLEGGRHIVRDLGSTNRTWVNGEPIDGDRPLSPGDRIEIGSTQIAYCEFDAVLDEVVGDSKETMIYERAESRDVFQGDLSEIPPYALLQVLELGSKTGVLKLRSGDQDGRIWFRDGAPIHAESEKKSGFDAALALVQVEAGDFRFELERVEVDATITASVTDLLLEALRELDENAARG